MKHLVSICLIFILSNSAHAESAQLVDEKEVAKWGYSTLNFESERHDSKITNTQVIKSMKEARGLKDHYYYFSLSQECFSGYLASFKRRLSLIFLKEKNYTLADLSGKCVRIINTGANFSTFTEQPRVFKLFREYLDENYT